MSKLHCEAEFRFESGALDIHNDGGHNDNGRAQARASAFHIERAIHAFVGEPDNETASLKVLLQRLTNGCDETPVANSLTAFVRALLVNRGVTDEQMSRLICVPIPASELDGCPQCGKSDDVMSIWTATYSVCHEHRCYWLFEVRGRPVESETPAEWHNNETCLRTYERVPPLLPPMFPSRKNDFPAGWHNRLPDDIIEGIF
jgi:hypothetical protein